VVEARKAAYLSVLGVDVYVPRPTPPLPSEIPAAVVARVAPPGVTTGEADVATRVSPPRSAPPRPAEPAKSPAKLRPVALDRPGQGLDWPALRATVAACERCALHATRTQTVFGVGDPRARWMFIGEAPGMEEDRQGEPFVGRAGQLLNSMIRALGFARQDVYIANVLKCRPPGNRDPRPEEAVACRSYLERQVELVNPTIVIAVGRIAAQDLLATETPIAKLRGKVHTFGARNWPLVVTYHPAYLLRSPGEKRKAWQDLLFAQQVFARAASERAVVAPP
jgi:uracil-DNA glycosylase family 4